VNRARFLLAARLEFFAEVRYYNAEQPGLGLRFSKAVEDCVTRTLAFPLTGSPGPAGTRRMFVKGFPFAVVYRREDDEVVIFALAHHRRAPGYWQARTT
jgi:plasmid stabilization system protein ParE